jgi:hypothetical protein
LGERIGAPGLPVDYDRLAAYLVGCERDRIGLSAAGRLCSDRTLNLARARTPWPMRALVGPAIAALLTPRVRAATGVAEPNRLLRWAVAALLWIRPRVVRLLPPRRSPTTPRTRRGLAPAPASSRPPRPDPTPPTPPSTEPTQA